MLPLIFGVLCVLGGGYGHAVNFHGPQTATITCPQTESSYFLSDPSNPCAFYWCVAGELVVPTALWCAEGSAVAPGYAGADNPCTAKHAACGGGGDGAAAAGSSAGANSGGSQTGGYHSNGQQDNGGSQGYPSGKSGDEYYYGSPQAAPAPATWSGNSAGAWSGQAGSWSNQAYPAPAPAANSYYPDPWPNANVGADPWWVPAGVTAAPTTASTPPTTPTVTTVDPAVTTKSQVTIVQAFGAGFGFGKGFIPATAFLTQDANIPGGTLIPYVHDLKACWRSCVYSFNCKGFDFDHHFGACWLHTDDTICSATVPKAHNSNYRLVHCATTVAPSVTTAAPGMEVTTGFGGVTTASPTNVVVKLATPFPNMHIPGGTFQAGISDMNACILSCQQNNMTCQGVDFDSNGNTCWFHALTSECMPFVAKTSCTHVRCGDPCGTTAANMIVPSSHALGGTLIASGTTLQACITSCTGTCVAIDFDTTNAANTCWHHMQATCNNIVTKANCVHVPITCV